MIKIKNDTDLKKVRIAIQKLEYLKGIVKNFKNQDKLDMLYKMVDEYLDDVSIDDFFTSCHGATILKVGKVQSAEDFFEV